MPFNSPQTPQTLTRAGADHSLGLSKMLLARPQTLQTKASAGGYYKPLVEVSRSRFTNFFYDFRKQPSRFWGPISSPQTPQTPPRAGTGHSLSLSNMLVARPQSPQTLPRVGASLFLRFVFALSNLPVVFRSGFSCWRLVSASNASKQLQ